MKKLSKLTVTALVLLLATSIKAADNPLAFDTNNQIQQTLNFSSNPNNALNVKNDGGYNSTVSLKKIVNGQSTQVVITDEKSTPICQVNLESQIVCSRGGPIGCIGFVNVESLEQLSPTVKCSLTHENTVIIANA